jgi:hypothetical protein
MGNEFGAHCTSGCSASCAYKIEVNITLSLGLKFPAVREVGILMAPRLWGLNCSAKFYCQYESCSSQPSAVWLDKLCVGINVFAASRIAQSSQ